MPAASVAARRMSRAGQARSGFTWSTVTGETPPQSSMPESRSGARSSDRLGGAWTWTSGGSTSRATAIVQASSSGGQGGRVVHGRARLGEEVLDDHLLDVAVDAVASRRWPPRVSRRSARDSPMPTRRPVVKGMASRAGGVEGGQPAFRGLVRGAPVSRPGRGRATRASSPGWPRPSRSRPRSSGAEGAGVGVGEQARLVDAPARRRPPGSRRWSRSRGRRASRRAAG